MRGYQQNRVLIASSLHERQYALLGELFGSKDELISAKEDDEELLAASRRAKVAVRKHKERFKAGPPGTEHLSVKAPFTTRTKGIEWMWVEVTRWDSQIHGVLQNDPYEVDGMKAGALVTVEEGSIFDYIYVGADGGWEGNETSRILTKRQH